MTEAHVHLRPPQAASYLGVAVATLSKWRVTGQGPLFARAGRAVVYRRRDLDAWLGQHTMRATSVPHTEAA
jgi:predicted DNA-binding transcriptional regulator AlpA